MSEQAGCDFCGTVCTADGAKCLKRQGVTFVVLFLNSRKSKCLNRQVVTFVVLFVNGRNCKMSEQAGCDFCQANYKFYSA